MLLGATGTTGSSGATDTTEYWATGAINQRMSLRDSSHNDLSRYRIKLTPDPGNGQLKILIMLLYLNQQTVLYAADLFESGGQVYNRLASILWDDSTNNANMEFSNLSKTSQTQQIG